MDGRLRITEMTMEDLPQVCRIERETFSMPWSQSGFADSLAAENTLYLCAHIDGEVVAYCGLLQVLEEADITNVAVAVTWRRQKIAYQMLSELLRRGRLRGIRDFTLEVRRSNTAALRLYERLGFADCGIRKNFYEKPAEDAVIMWNRGPGSDSR